MQRIGTQTLNGDIRYLKPAQEIGWLITDKSYDDDTRRFRTNLNSSISKLVIALISDPRFLGVAIRNFVERESKR